MARLSRTKLSKLGANLLMSQRTGFQIKVEKACRAGEKYPE